MHRLCARFIPVAALLLVVSGCGGDGDTPTTPEPIPDVVDSFSGVLTTSGAATHTFKVSRASQIVAQLVSLTPNSEKTISVSLGTWNGSICQIVLANDATKQGDIVPGATQAAGDFCLRVLDPNGSVTEAQFYVVLVTHQ